MSNFFRSCKPSKDFELVPGGVLRDLDVLTIGVYGKLLTLTDEWETSIKGLAKSFDISEDKARKCINCLESVGYLQRIPRRSVDGRALVGWDYIVLGVQAEENDRTSAGTRLSQNQTSLKSDKSEKGGLNNTQTYKDNQTYIYNQNNPPIYPPKVDECAEASASHSQPSSDVNLISVLTTAAERIYGLYPSHDPVTKRSLGKSRKDIGKIVKLLKSGEQSEETLTAIIKRYLDEHRTGYLQNLRTFLNNIPDYSSDALDIFQQAASDNGDVTDIKFDKYQ